MKLIEFAFRLGVIFAIFGFIWGIIQLCLALLRGVRPKSIMEEYSLKFVQYFFLVDVTFLFCVNKQDDSNLLINELIFAGLILILNFVGKLQNKQQRQNMFQISGVSLPKIQNLFNMKAEIGAILFGITIFTAFIFFPTYAQNPISKWFYASIIDIEGTFFFGFIFKIIGFFFLMSIFMKIANGIAFLVSGRPLTRARSINKEDKQNDSKFDDFEEL